MHPASVGMVEGTGMVERVWVVASTLLVAALLSVACGGGSESSEPDTTTTSAPAEDVDITAADFPNVNTLTPIGNHFVGNLLGNVDGTLAVARAGEGRYPVGTLIQLVPFEAMVKRHAGYSPSTNDWEFFSLDVSAEGTTILARGTKDVVNRFGGNCASCHQAARPEFDFVCDKDNGCEPLPIGDDVIMQLQQADPRSTG
jgi:hypothetical protein